MPKIPRVTAKIFASNAAEDDIGQFGSALTGSKVLTSDIAEIQALPAYEEGWRGAVISNRNYPTLQEMNGVQKTFSQQLAYLFQMGIPEWDALTTFYLNSFSQINGVLYQSSTDENTGNNPEADTANWKKIDLEALEGLTETLSTKASTALDNLTSEGKAVIPGKIHTSYLQLLSAGSISVGTRSLDLSSYLPEDNYNYEVLLSCFAAHSGSATSGAALQSSLITTNMGICACNSNSSAQRNTVWMPIGKNRILKYIIVQTAMSGSNTVEAFAYRRIGNND